MKLSGYSGPHFRGRLSQVTWTYTQLMKMLVYWPRITYENIWTASSLEDDGRWVRRQSIQPAALSVKLCFHHTLDHHKAVLVSQFYGPLAEKTGWKWRINRKHFGIIRGGVWDYVLWMKFQCTCIFLIIKNIEDVISILRISVDNKFRKSGKELVKRLVYFIE